MSDLTSSRGINAICLIVLILTALLFSLHYLCRQSHSIESALLIGTATEQSFPLKAYPEGTAWTEGIVIPRGERLIIDMGRAVTFTTLDLQHDGHDRFTILYGKTPDRFRFAGSVSAKGSGLRDSQLKLIIPRTARYFKILPHDGDGRYSFSFLQANFSLFHLILKLAWGVVLIGFAAPLSLYLYRHRERYGVQVAIFALFSVAVAASYIWFTRTGALGDSIHYLRSAHNIIAHGSEQMDNFYPNATPDKFQFALIWHDRHWYNLFPIGTTLLTIPFLFVAQKIVAAPLEPAYAAYGPANSQWLAVFFSALSLFFLLLAARRLLSFRLCLLLGFIYAFATSMFSVGGAGLNQHIPTCLMLSIVLYLTLKSREKPSAIAWGGLFLALAYLIRPTNAISVAGFTIYVLIYHRRYFLPFVMFGALIGACFFAYNLSVFNAWLPPYFQPGRVGFGDWFFTALAGNLISPNRGLLITCPIVIFSAIGLTLGVLRPSPQRKLYVLLGIIVVLHWITISTFGHWWAGYYVGNRFFSDMMPYLCLLMIPALQYLFDPSEETRRRYTRWAGLAAFGAILGASLFVNFRLAYYPECQLWNAVPKSVDKYPERVWDWGDIQFMRGWGE